MNGSSGDLECCCSLCGMPVAGAEASTGEVRCAACFTQFLRRVDADYLDNYARLGARSHLVVAETCLRGLVLSEMADRRLLAMTIYERFVASATDLIGLYHALRNRRNTPIIQSVLEFKLAIDHGGAFFVTLASAGPVDLLRSLGLPHPDQLAAPALPLDRRERAQVRAALSEALADLERLVAFETVGQQALIGAALGMRGPVAITDSTAWLTDVQPSSGQVAALSLDAGSRRLAVNLFSTDEETLGTVVDGIDIMTRLVRNIIFAFVSLHGPAQFGNGFAGK